MNCNEFSREFDILYNNITSNQAPSLNSYEKSVLLTQAQEEIVLSLYRGDNKKSFDLTEEIASYLSSIIFDVEIKEFDTSIISDLKGFTDKYNVTTTSVLDNTENCWFIAYESALVSFEDRCNTSKVCDVIPTTYDAFARDSKNPFKKPNKHRVLRLNIGLPFDDNNKRSIYLIHSKNSTISNYHITYLKRPNPIILEDLDTEFAGYNLSINGENNKSECELSTALHRQILYKAVDLAKAIWTSTIINSENN